MKYFKPKVAIQGVGLLIGVVFCSCTASSGASIGDIVGIVVGMMAVFGGVLALVEGVKNNSVVALVFGGVVTTTSLAVLMFFGLVIQAGFVALAGLLFSITFD